MSHFMANDNKSGEGSSGTTPGGLPISQPSGIS